MFLNVFCNTNLLIFNSIPHIEGDGSLHSVDIPHRARLVAGAGQQARAVRRPRDTVHTALVRTDLWRKTKKYKKSYRHMGFELGTFEYFFNSTITRS